MADPFTLATRLHDAVVKDLCIDWAEATVRIGLSVYPGTRAQIVVQAFRRVQVPRVNPWGESECINTAAISLVDAEVQLLTIEMQSGDIIEIEASGYILDVEGEGMLKIG